VHIKTQLGFRRDQHIIVWDNGDGHLIYDWVELNIISLMCTTSAVNES
jgi:hypothetical protein